MTEEIKEILYMLKSVIDNPKETFCVNATTCYLLLNYIINLQKENERLKENNKRKTSRCTEINHKIRARDRIIERRNKKIDKLEDYKSRNEKAVEYIENHTENIDRGTYYEDYVETYDLLNILQGGDE